MGRKSRTIDRANRGQNIRDSYEDDYEDFTYPKTLEQIARVRAAIEFAEENGETLPADVLEMLRTEYPELLRKEFPHLLKKKSRPAWQPARKSAAKSARKASQDYENLPPLASETTPGFPDWQRIVKSIFLIISWTQEGAKISWC